jgi:hypothetical protein
LSGVSAQFATIRSILRGKTGDELRESSARTSVRATRGQSGKTAYLLFGFPTEKKIDILSTVSFPNNQCEINGNNHGEIAVDSQREINMPKLTSAELGHSLPLGRCAFVMGVLRLAIPSRSDLLRRLTGLGFTSKKLTAEKS